MPTSESNSTPVTSTVKDGKSNSNTRYNDINHTSFSWLSAMHQLLPAAGDRPVANETRPLLVFLNDTLFPRVTIRNAACPGTTSKCVYFTWFRFVILLENAVFASHESVFVLLVMPLRLL
jgi:hypothetical protein|tara:strand:+ start:27 stop:386 length:360 start_codon:yes stop_codon:yes gene_type:complete